MIKKIAIANETNNINGCSAKKIIALGKSNQELSKYFWMMII